MTNVQRRQREKEQRRIEIISAAEELFFSKGYDNVTMDDIAARVELNKATIYLYFENKEALFFAIVLRGVKRLADAVEESVRWEGSGTDKLWAAWNAYGRHVRENPDHFQAYGLFYSGRFGLDKMVAIDPVGKSLIPGFTSQTVFNLPNGDYVQEILEQHRKVFEAIRGAVKQSIDEGATRPDREPSEVAGLLLMLAESSLRMNPLIINEMGQHGISKDRFMKHLQDYISLA